MSARRIEPKAPAKDEAAETDDRGRRYLYLAPDGEPEQAANPADRARAREEIGRLCEDEELDARTCELTERALR